MKFSTILAAALPVFASASALPGHQGADGGNDPSGTGQWTGGPGEGWGQGQGASQGPPAGSQGNSPMAGDGPGSGQHQHRDLDVRADGDYLMEECLATNQLSQPLPGCKYQTIIVKGKTKGLCIPTIYPKEMYGYIMPVDANVMCTYYEKDGCTGGSRGPWTKQDKTYNRDAIDQDYFRWRPQSYQCNVYTFGAYTAPPTMIWEEK